MLELGEADAPWPLYALPAHDISPGLSRDATTRPGTEGDAGFNGVPPNLRSLDEPLARDEPLPASEAEKRERPRERKLEPV